MAQGKKGQLIIDSLFTTGPYGAAAAGIVSSFSGDNLTLPDVGRVPAIVPVNPSQNIPVVESLIGGSDPPNPIQANPTGIDNTTLMIILGAGLLVFLLVIE